MYVCIYMYVYMASAASGAAAEEPVERFVAHVPVPSTEVRDLRTSPFRRPRSVTGSGRDMLRREVWRGLCGRKGRPVDVRTRDLSMVDIGTLHGRHSPTQFHRQGAVDGGAGSQNVVKWL